MTLRRFAGAIVLLCLFLQANSQDGWRTGEMEVQVSLHSQTDAAVFRALGLNAEPATPDGSISYVYATPAELAAIRSSGLDFTVTIPDLNTHSRYLRASGILDGYYNYSTITALADSLAAAFPSICKKYLLGTSAGGRDLAVLKISDHVELNENEPEILFEGGIHGDELMGPEVVIRYARDLCKGYGIDSLYTDLVNNREIWMYYLVNPDGYVSVSRYNGNGVDINRDCGYMWNGGGNSPAAFSQPETRVIRDLQATHNFVLFTDYHGGSEVIAYPWSYKTESPADLVQISYLASVYSDVSGYQYLPYGQGYNIMYQIFGSTKDLDYGPLGQAGWSIELTSLKQPPYTMIPMYYGFNVPSITEMIRRSGWGIEGTVTDSVTGSPVRARIWVDGFFPSCTDPLVGDYHKFILPGPHAVRVTASGYHTKLVNSVVVPAEGTAVLNFHLSRDAVFSAYRVIGCQIPSYPTNGSYLDSSYTPAVSGGPDSITYALGRGGWIIVDPGDTLFNLAGNDITVWESGGTPEGFSCFGSIGPDGPWSLLGAGTGTTSFDLASGSLIKARYLKITDDGDGPANADSAGFDLDGITLLHPPLRADLLADHDTICTGTSVNFSDYSTGDPTSWSWTFPGGVPGSSTEKDPQGIIYSAPGTYDVSLFVTNAAGAATITRSGYIQVQDAPEVNLGPDSLLCMPDSVLLDAGNPGCTYLWSTGATTRTLWASAGYPGMYQFSVVVSLPENCTATDTISLEYVICDAVPGYDEAQNISVVPNPSPGMFTVSSPTPEGFSYRIVTSGGQELPGGVIPKGSGTFQVDLSGYPDGIYLLVMTFETGTRSVRLVKN